MADCRPNPRAYASPQRNPILSPLCCTDICTHNATHWHANCITQRHPNGIAHIPAHVKPNHATNWSSKQRSNEIAYRCTNSNRNRNPTTNIHADGFSHDQR